LRVLCIALVSFAVAGCAIYDKPTSGGQTTGSSLSAGGAGGEGPETSAGGAGTSAAGDTGAGGASAGASGEDMDGNGSAGTGAGGTDFDGSGGTGAQDASTPRDAGVVAVALPFVVDSYFVATGYMGDAIHPGVINVQTVGCLPRPAGARGHCYKVTYKPQPPAVAGQAAWAGVYWLAPQDNWGQRPGRKIEPGATTVTFYAAGQTGTESVTFRAGGVQDISQPYQDTFRIEQTETLSTTLTSYSLDLVGQTYDQVIGGFAWIVTTNDSATWDAGAPPIIFYIDDIEWMKSD